MSINMSESGVTRDPISWHLWSLAVSFTVGGGEGLGEWVADFTLPGQRFKTTAPRGGDQKFLTQINHQGWSDKLVEGKN